MVRRITTWSIRSYPLGASFAATDLCWPLASRCRIDGNRITVLDRDDKPLSTYIFPFQP